MGCKYLSKTFNNKFKCRKHHRGVIYYIDCKNCLDFILTKNKPIKKVSNKRIFVKKEVYDYVLQRDKCCRLKDKTCEGKLELHHIVYRSEDKSLINEPSNCIMLCVKHHSQVHSNKHYWQPKLLKLIGGKNDYSKRRRS